MVPDDSSIADIFIEIWRCMTPQKRSNTLIDLERYVGIELGDLAQETRYMLELVNEIINLPPMIQA